MSNQNQDQKQLKMEEKKNQKSSLKVPPYNLVNDGEYYNQHLRFNGKQGHGFAAERANNEFDKWKFKDATVLDENIKNGCDRIVDGVQIQVKYCKNAEAAFRNCFDNNGEFRYQGQKIEVPPEQFEKVQALFKEKGYNDVVSKGQVSYKTAKAIAKSGTIEGITYDVAQGIRLSLQAFGLSALISFSLSLWSGKSKAEALQDCIRTSGQVFGLTLVSHLAAQQFARSSLNGFGHQVTLNVLKKVLSPQDFAAYANGVRNEVQKKIYGAAAQQNVGKIVKGQAVFNCAMVLLQTGWDFQKLVRGKISGQQLAKNLSCNVAGAGGSLAFSLYGTLLGGPIGGIIGGLIGGIASSFALKKILDQITPDDLVKMKRLLDQILNQLQAIYLLIEKEQKSLMDQIEKDLIKKGFLQTLFEKTGDKEKYAKKQIKPYFKKIINQRRYITVKEFTESFKEIDNQE